LTRHPANPVLTATDWPYPVNSVFNPGAALVDGETVLLCRVEDRRGMSHLTVARSADGIGGWRIDTEPLIVGNPADDTERWGVEDPRITRVEELGGWLIAYTAVGSAGPCVALSVTQDFRTAERVGVVMPPEDKNAAMLSRHVGGEYVLFHRPVSRTSGRADVWLSRSHDLRSWTSPEPVLAARPGVWWDSARVGMGPPPLETPHGWLGFYHGVNGSSTVWSTGWVWCCSISTTRRWCCGVATNGCCHRQRAMRSPVTLPTWCSRPVSCTTRPLTSCGCITVRPTPASQWSPRRCPRCWRTP